MSGHESMRLEELRDECRAVAKEAGAIDECDLHPGNFIDLEDEEAQEEAVETITGRYEMHGDAAVEEARAVMEAVLHAAGECQECEKIRSSD